MDIFHRRNGHSIDRNFEEPEKFSIKDFKEDKYACMLIIV